MISGRRVGGTPISANRRSNPRAQSGSRILEPGDAVDGGDERFPAAALAVQDRAPDRRQPVIAGGPQDPARRRAQPVIAAAPLSGLFDPLPFDPAALLEAVEQRVERGDVVA